MANAIKYISNVGKSVVYQTVDTLKEMNPVLTDFVETNTETAKAMFTTIRNIRLSDRRIMSKFTDNKYGELGVDMINNLIDDIKTGKYYNRERMKAAEDAAFASLGGDMDFGIDDGFDMSSDMGLDDTGDSLSDVDILSDSMDNVGAKASSAVSQVIAHSAQSQIEAQRQMHNHKIFWDNKLVQNIRGDIGILNTNISNLVKFNSEAMTTHMENSRKFYESQTNMMSDLTNLVKELVDMQKSIYSPKKKGQYVDSVESIMSYSGNINIAEYMKYIKKNIGNEIDNTGIKGMLDAAIDMGAGKTLTASPISYILGDVIKKTIPETLSKAMEELNDTIGNTFSNVLMKITRLQGSSNGVLSKIGDIFGLHSSVQTELSSNSYEKGAMQWNGKAQKSLVEVIPTYLSKILSTLNGQDELIYDFEKGKFTNLKAIKKEYRQLMTNSSRSAAGSAYYKLSNMIDQIDFQGDAAKREQFQKNLDQFLEYHLKKQKVFNPNSTKNSLDSRTYGLTAETRAQADLNLKYIQQMFKSLSKKEQMQMAKAMIDSTSNHNRQMQNISESADSVFLNLINGAHGTIGTDTLSEAAQKSPKLKLLSNTEYLHNIYEELVYIRKYSIPSIGNGANAASGSASGNKKHKKPSFNKFRRNLKVSSRLSTPETPSAINNTYFSARMQLTIKHNTTMYDDCKNNAYPVLDIPKDAKVESDGKIQSGYVRVSYDAKIGWVKLHSIVEKADYIKENASNDSSSGIYGQEIEFSNNANNEETQQSFIERLEAAETTSEKFKVLASGLGEIAKAPAKVMASMLKKVDDRIYKLLFNEDKDPEDDTTSTIGRIFHKIDDYAKHAMDSFTETFQEWKKKLSKDNLKSIFDRFKKALGITTDGTIFENFGAKVRQSASNAFNWVKGGFKSAKSGASSFMNDVFGGENNASGDTVDEYNQRLKDIQDSLGDIENAASGMKRVKKTGLVAVSKGEMIVPPDMNPYNIERRYRNENEAIGTFKRGLGLDDDTSLNIARYAEGNALNPDEYETFISEHSETEINQYAKVDKNFRQYYNYRRNAKKWGSIAKSNKDAASSLHALEQLNRIATGLKDKGDPNYKLYKDQIDSLYKKKKRSKDYKKGTTFGDKMIDEAASMLQMFRDEASNIISMTKEELGVAEDKKGLSKNREAFKNATSDVLSNLKEYLPDFVVGAGIGGGVSLLTGAIGGPLLGAAAGGAISLVKNSDMVQQWLFGERDVNGDRKGGLLSKHLSQNIEKYFPSMAKGAVVGGITSILPFVPGGPVTGVILGSAVGFAKQNKEFMDMMFGFDENGVSNREKIAKKLSNIAPRMGVGAIAGALAGPFGLTTNILLGSAMGFASDTEAFKQLMFGNVGVDGQRTGGVFGFIKKELISPVTGWLKEQGQKTLDWFKKEVKDPLARNFKIFGKALINNVRNIASIFKDQLSVATTPIGKYLTQLFRPLRSFTGFMAKLPITITKGIIQSPIRLMTRVANTVQAHQLRSGQADNMSALERLQARDDLDERHNSRLSRRIARGVGKFVTGGKYDQLGQRHGLKNDKYLQIDKDMSMASDEDITRLTNIVGGFHDAEGRRNQRINVAANTAFGYMNSIDVSILGATTQQYISKALKAGDGEAALAFLDKSKIAKKDPETYKLLRKKIQEAIKEIDAANVDFNTAKEDTQYMQQVLKEMGWDIDFTNKREVERLYHNLSTEEKARLSGKAEDINSELTRLQQKKYEDRMETITSTIKKIYYTLEASANPASKDPEVQKIVKQREQYWAQDGTEDNYKRLSHTDGVSYGRAKLAHLTGATNNVKNTTALLDDEENMSPELRERMSTMAHLLEYKDQIKMWENLLDNNTVHKRSDMMRKPGTKDGVSDGSDMDNDPNTRTTTDANGNIIRYRKDRFGEDVIDTSDDQTKATLRRQDEEKKSRSAMIERLDGIKNTMSGVFTNLFGDKNDGQAKQKKGLFGKILGGLDNILGVKGKTIAAALGFTALIGSPLGDTILKTGKQLLFGDNKDGLVYKIADMFNTHILPALSKGANWLFNTALPTVLTDFLPGIISTVMTNLPTYLSAAIDGLIDGIGNLFSSILGGDKSNTKRSGTFTNSSGISLGGSASTGATATTSLASSSTDGLTYTSEYGTVNLAGGTTTGSNTGTTATAVTSNAPTTNAPTSGTITPGTTTITESKSDLEKKVKSTLAYQNAAPPVQTKALPLLVPIINNAINGYAGTVYTLLNDDTFVIGQFADDITGEVDTITGATLFYSAAATMQILGINISLTTEERNKYTESLGYDRPTGKEALVKTTAKAGLRTMTAAAFRKNGLNNKAIGKLTGGISKLSRGLGKAASGITGFIAPLKWTGLNKALGKGVTTIAGAPGKAIEYGQKAGNKLHNAIYNTADEAVEAATKGADDGAEKITQKIAKNADDITDKAAEKAVKNVDDVAEKGAKKVGKIATEAATSGNNKTITKFIASAVEGITKFLKDSKVASMFTKALSKVGNVVKGADKVWLTIIEGITGAISKRLEKTLFKSAAKAVAKIGTYAGSLGIAAVVDAVIGFVKGYDQANTILGITEQPNILIRCVAGTLQALDEVFLLGFIPLDVLFDLIWGILTKVCPGLKETNLDKERKEAQAELAAYNEKNGTNLTLEEYNNRNKWWKPAADAIKGAGKAIGNFAGGVWDGAKNLAGKAWDGIKGAGSAIANTAGKVWDGAKNLASGAWNGAKAVAGGVANTAGKVVSGAKNLASGAWNGAKNLVGSGIDTAKEAAANVINKASEMANSIAETAKNAASNIRDKVGSMVSNVGEKLGGVASSLKEKFSDVAGGIKEKVSGVFSTVSDTASKLLGGAKETVSKVKDKAKDAIDKAKDKVKSTAENVVDKAKDIGSAVKDKASGAWKSAKNFVGGLFGAAEGVKRVDKTGLITVSEGEMVVPADLNPYNVSQRKRGENNIASKLGDLLGTATGKVKSFANKFTQSDLGGGLKGVFNSLLGSKDYLGTDDITNTQSTSLNKKSKGSALQQLFSTVSDVTDSLMKDKKGSMAFIKALPDKLSKATDAVNKKLAIQLGLGSADDKNTSLDILDNKKKYEEMLNKSEATSSLASISNAIDGEYIDGNGKMKLVKYKKNIKGTFAKFSNTVKNKLVGFVSKFMSYAGSGSGIAGMGSGTGKSDDSKFVSQLESKYRDMDFYTSLDANRTSIAQAGCAPAAATMAVNTVNSSSSGSLNMRDAANVALGYKLPNDGVTADYFVDQFNRQDMDTMMISNSKDKNVRVKNLLRKGHPVILMGRDVQNDSKSKSPYGPNNHYVVATGLSKDGRNININDPEAKRPGVVYDAERILSSSSLGVSPIARNSKVAKINAKIKQYLKKFAGKGTYDESSPQYKVWTRVRGAGYSEYATAALMGNIQAESGFDPTLIEVGTGQGYGLIQWTGGRRDQLTNFAAARGKDKSDIDVQIEMMLVELDPNANDPNANYQWINNKVPREGRYYTIDDWKNSNDLTVATAALCWCWERPNEKYARVERRVEAAKKYYQEFTGTPGIASTYSSSTSTSTTSMSISSTATSSTANATKGLNEIFNVFDDLAKAFNVADSSSTSTDDSTISSPVVVPTTIGKTVSDEEKAKLQVALVNKMKSIQSSLRYSQTDRDPDKGSGDCSSTVAWAYKKILGVDPGVNSTAQLTDTDLYTVPNASASKESTMQLGDLLVRDGHVEMYAGNGQIIGHGGGQNGEKMGPTLSNIGWFAKQSPLVRRWIGFKEAGSGSGLKGFYSKPISGKVPSLPEDYYTDDHDISTNKELVNMYAGMGSGTINSSKSVSMKSNVQRPTSKVSKSSNTSMNALLTALVALMQQEVNNTSAIKEIAELVSIMANSTEKSKITDAAAQQATNVVLAKSLAESARNTDDQNLMKLIKNVEKLAAQ